MPDLWEQMTSGFMPHGFCLQWDGPLLTVWIIGNAGIAIAYMLIPLALKIFIGKRKDLPYAYMFNMFSLFILSCSVTHMIKIWTIYQPVYWIEAAADLWTAVVSLLTAAMLLPLIPKALALRSPKELQMVNDQLLEANKKLQQSEELLQSKIEERTSELGKALHEARLSEQQFRSLFDLMPQLSWTAAADGSIDYFNNGTYEFSGKTPAEMLGWGWASIHAPEAVPAVLEKWQFCLDNVIPFEMEFSLRRHDGVYCWFLARIKPLIDQDGKLVSWIGIGTDIEEQKRGAELLERRVKDRTAELEDLNERLSENEKKLRVMFDQTYEQAELLDLTHDTIMVRDLTGVIRFWNHGAEEMYGFNKGEAIGQRSHDLLKTEFPEPLNTINAALTENQRWDGELIHYSKAGERLVSASRWTLKPPFEVLEMNSDITKRKDAELKLAVSNNDLQQFAYVASHDLQEPLRTIKSFSELLNASAGDSLDEDSKTYLGVIVESVGRMQQLVRDLLNYARVDTQGMPLVALDINEPFNEALLSLNTAINESNAAITHDPLPMVLGDKTQLSALFQNFFANAIKFRGEEAPKIHVSVMQTGNQWQFTVTDNGIGLNMEYAERIFVVFQRLHTRNKYSGTGIGLAVCKRIVERHGGSIGVESEEGHGARFWFKLPAAPKESGE